MTLATQDIMVRSDEPSIAYLNKTPRLTQDLVSVGLNFAAAS